MRLPRITSTGWKKEATGMGWFSRDKERDRYYLLPGMGKRALRRKRRTSLAWALAVGLLVSAALAAAIYWFAIRAPQ